MTSLGLLLVLLLVAGRRAFISRSGTIGGNCPVRLRNLLDVYLQMEMNVIFISGARTFDDGGRTGVGPDLQGSIKDKITYAFDLFFYMFKDFDEDGKVRRIITTEGTRRLEAKSRSRWMPSEMVNPTMQDIYQVFRDAREKKEES